MAISDRSVSPEPVPDRLNRLLEFGVGAVQLRDKTASDRIRYSWLKQVNPSGKYVLVNGRWDLAALTGSDGVHCPSTGLPLSVLRSLRSRNDFIYGRSTHSLEDVLKAQEEGMDYVTFGPIFPTPSKPELDRENCPGLKGLSKVTDETNIPVLALGGVTVDRIKKCLEAGAYGAAGIRALFEPEDPSRHWREIHSTLNDFFGGH
ncbi:MAG: thiamine phosphate synthase [bacterium]